MEKIRFGIAGFGLHAAKRLMPALAFTEHSEVVALSRRDPIKAQESAAQFRVQHAFTSTADLARCADVDAVFVATPDAFHLQDTLTALAAGKPVLCEKPMAKNAAEVERMIAAAGTAGLLLGVAQVFRFEQSTRRFRQRIANGDIGLPLLARAEFTYPALESPRAWISNPTLAIGGPIADVGVHCIDALRFMLDDEVVAVNCSALTDSRSEPLECAGLVSLEFARKTLATVSVSARAQYRTLLEVTGERGSLVAIDGLNVERPIALEWRSQIDPRIVDREVVDNQRAYALQFDAFAKAVLEQIPFPASADDGLRNQRILDAAFRSWHSGTHQLL